MYLTYSLTPTILGGEPGKWGKHNFGETLFSFDNPDLTYMLTTGKFEPFSTKFGLT